MVGDTYTIFIEKQESKIWEIMTACKKMITDKQHKRKICKNNCILNKRVIWIIYILRVERELKLKQDDF